MYKNPMKMPTQFGLIVFHREKRGRIIVEELVTVLRTAGIMVAVLEDFEYCKKIEAEKFQDLDFILLPKKTYASFPEFPSETKVCYYSAEDDLFEILLAKLEIAEANELRKIKEVLEKYQLFDYLAQINLNIIHSYNYCKFRDKLLDFDEAIAAFNADIFSTMHLGFANLYLKHFCNNIYDRLSYIPDYFQDFEQTTYEVLNWIESLKDADKKDYFSLIFLLTQEIQWRLLNATTKRYYYTLYEVKINYFIQNELKLQYLFYMKKQLYTLIKYSTIYLSRLIPGVEVKYFHNFSIFSFHILMNRGEIGKVVHQANFENYLKIYQDALKNDLNNFTPSELIHFFRLSNTIAQKYITEDEIKKNYPFEAVLIEKAKQYNFEHRDNTLKSCVCYFGFGIHDWTKQYFND